MVSSCIFHNGIYNKQKNNNAVYLYILIDCPDLLLETKRHIGEGDLRSVVSLYTHANDYAYQFSDLFHTLRIFV